ncbi:pyridoxamine 5'-phosphate oxidase family protein [Cryptosporangium phraense]|uniref:Pyridoxamine 5'-phosphate oxidase family protein n=1 Tax=Cryptosporangium phraense TaxID=2593070 RepID=A0A545AWC6_9ACTN|nr:pyridoxamine 5'-phosphate oxidase family protein [Cryptosporangium phraense]TQS45627.1 pyridoxamine 5'-phosphate oxidase family protein [Cryptosporangium phraense]
MEDARTLLEDYVRSGKVIQLATLDATGAPVVCNLWFASEFGPDRIWFMSRPNREHCVNLRSDPRVAGAILAIELEGIEQDVRGVTFSGQARELPTTGIDEQIAGYTSRWPDAIDPVAMAADPDGHHLYEITVSRWVLFDEQYYPDQPRQPVPAQRS